MRATSLALAMLVLCSGSAPVTIAQSADDPVLFYSTEVVPAAECDVEPIDPAVVREIAARVYARPVDATPETVMAEPPAVGVHVVATERQLRTSSTSVYVDGEPFIKEGRPVPDGVPASPFETVNRATVESIQDFMRLRAACFNAGDPARSSALFTVSGLETAIQEARADYLDHGNLVEGVEQSMFDDISDLNVSIPLDEQLLAPVVGDVRVSSDGSAAVYGLFSMNIQNASTGAHGRQVDAEVLAFVDGRWLIQESLPSLKAVEIAQVSERDPSTPVSDSGTPSAGMPRSDARPAS